MMRNLLAFFVLVCILHDANVATAQDSPAPEQDIATLEKRVEEGDLGATKELAEIYSKSWEPANKEKAFNLYMKLADAGDLDAIDRVGSMYQRGKGVATSIDSAIEWHTKAADQGHAEAQYNLGMIYYRWRLGGKYYYDKSEQRLTEAASQGHLKAQFQLGEMYFYGTKIKKDLAKSIDWLTKAAESGHEASQATLGERYMSSGEYELAHKWLLEAAKQNNTGAQVLLGGLYEKGAGVSADPEQALHWYMEASTRSNVKGLMAAYHLHDNAGNYEMARAFLFLAAGRNYRPAMDEHSYVWQATPKKKRKEIRQKVRQILEQYPSLTTSTIEKWLAKK